LYAAVPTGFMDINVEKCDRC